MLALAFAVHASAAMNDRLAHPTAPARIVSLLLPIAQRVLEVVVVIALVIGTLKLLFHH